VAVIRVQSLHGNDVTGDLRGGYAVWVGFHCRPSESGKLMAWEQELQFHICCHIGAFGLKHMLGDYDG